MNNDDENRPHWLDEFEDMANEDLTEGSACKQIHPIIQRWYDNLMDGEPPASRDAVLQAIACLSSELLFDMPDRLTEALFIDDRDVTFTETSLWIQEVLMIGRAFQIALDNGDLDDL
jgi:hypothetical protein